MHVLYPQQARPAPRPVAARECPLREALWKIFCSRAAHSELLLSHHCESSSTLPARHQLRGLGVAACTWVTACFLSSVVHLTSCPYTERSSPCSSSSDTVPFSALFTLQRDVLPCSLTYCCMYSILGRARYAGLADLLRVCAAAVSCILVGVKDRGPTAVARFQVHAVHLTNMVLQQHFIPEHHIINSSMELFHGLVPAWRMLHFSASTLERDRTVEHCLSNHMPSDCLVLGSHSDVRTVTVCIRLSLSHNRVWFCMHCT